jgi:predicted nucleic acid-binding protein
VIVIDASALTELLIGGTPRAAVLAPRIRDEELHAPHLIDLEVASVFRSLEARGLATTVASRAIDDLRMLALRRHAHDVLVARVWQLRGNLTAHDAAYVALAEALNAPLVTCDANLAKAPGHRATVELFP